MERQARRLKQKLGKCFDSPDFFSLNLERRPAKDARSRTRATPGGALRRLESRPTERYCPIYGDVLPQVKDCIHPRFPPEPG